jgi:two-component system sensor histidine kinase/response regulator
MANGFIVFEIMNKTPLRLFRLNIRAKVLILALVLAWPPLVIVSMLGLSSLNIAQESAVRSANDALLRQAENNFEKRAADKAEIYGKTFNSVRQQVESIAVYTRVLIDSPPPPTSDTGRVWISPDGASPELERQYATSVARARQIIPLLQSVARRNPLINLGYVALEDGGIVAYDHDIIDLVAMSKPNDIRTSAWYTTARQAGRTVWVDAYIDPNTNKLVTTCATPIYDSRGNFVGVAGFDLLLDTFQKDIVTLDAGTQGYTFIMNSQGKVIVQPDLQFGDITTAQPLAGENLLTAPNQELREAAERMVQRQQSVEQITYRNEEIYLAYAPIETPGWSVGIIVPKADIVALADAVGVSIGERQEQLRTQVLTLFAIVAIAIPAVGLVLSMVLTKPLRELQIGAQRIATGDLSYKIKVTSDDEIGTLVQSFNAMTTTLQQKVDELEENLRQLATLNDISNHFKTTLSLDDLYEEIPKTVCDDFGFDRAALYVREGNLLRAAGATFGLGFEGQAKEFIDAVNAASITLDGTSVEADIARSRQTIIIDNPWEHPQVISSIQETLRSDSYVQAPIFGNQEQMIGILLADNHHSARAVTGRDAAQLLTFASMAGLTIENARLYTELERQVAQRTVELRDALDRAREADRLKGQFLASISHELRTPLNAIIGFSTVLLDELDGPITPMQREDLRTINQNGRFLLHLINELLDLARIESGKIELDLEAVDMAALIHEVVETVQGLLHNKPITIQVVLPLALPRPMADKAKTRQILLNLLSNAVKFTKQGDIVVSARCVVIAQEQGSQSNAEGHAATNGADSGKRSEPYLAVSVRDPGIGIAPEHLPLIFEEFRRVHEGRGGPHGSGLGLAIARKLVEAHNGRIWAESVVGQGSTFTFTLPVDLQPNNLTATRPGSPGAHARGTTKIVNGHARSNHNHSTNGYQPGGAHNGVASGASQPAHEVEILQ